MMSKLVAVLGVVGVSLLAGCATAADATDATETMASEEAVATTASALNECPIGSKPDMVHLVKLALTHQAPTTPAVTTAFTWISGRTELAIGNGADQAKLNRMRLQYEAATGNPFDTNFHDFADRLTRVAKPAMSAKGKCGTLDNYFAVPFTPAEATSVLPKLQWFFNNSQQQSILNKPCPASWLADQGTSFPNGTVCAFTDPNFAAGDNDPHSFPHIFGAVGGKNWAEVAGTTFVATTDPNTSWDAFGMSTIKLTVYRGPSEATTMMVGDTAAFQMEYAGTNYGTWQATIIGGASTGSKALYRLDGRLY